MKQKPKEIQMSEVIIWISTLVLVAMFAAIGICVTVIEAIEYGR